MSLKTIERIIKEIDDLKYVGSGYSGHWEKVRVENVPQGVPQDVPHQTNDSISLIEKEIELNNAILRQSPAERVDLDYVDNGNDDCLGKVMVENNFLGDSQNDTHDTKNDTHNDTHDTQNDTHDDTKEKIIRMIQTNPKVSTADIAKELGVGIATVKRKIKKIPNVSYVRSGYSGHWELIDK